MENTPVMMEEKLGFVKVLKKAFTIPLQNPHFIIFAFLTSLPLYCFMIPYEIILQHTLIDQTGILPQSSNCKHCFDSTSLGFVDRLIKKESATYLLQLVLFYVGILSFLEFISIIAVVDSTAAIYMGKKTMNLKEMLQRLVKETRFKGPLLTAITVLSLAFIILFGLFSSAIHVYLSSNYVMFMVLFGVIFIALLAKSIEWTVIWSMGIVISILEEKQGEVALLISSYLSRGNRQRGLLFVLVFFLWSLALRLSCFYFGRIVEARVIVVTAAHMSLVCIENVMKWVAFVVYFYDCKKRSEEKIVVATESNAVA